MNEIISDPQQSVLTAAAGAVKEGKILFSDAVGCRQLNRDAATGDPNTATPPFVRTAANPAMGDRMIIGQDLPFAGHTAFYRWEDVLLTAGAEFAHFGYQHKYVIFRRLRVYVPRYFYPSNRIIHQLLQTIPED